MAVTAGPFDNRTWCDRIGNPAATSSLPVEITRIAVERATLTSAMPQDAMTAMSMGKADFVPQVLANLGVKQVFHRVSQQPGKPLWVGTGQNRQSVFALPGNPVSTLVCCRHYVLPALLKASGRRGTIVRHAILAKDLRYEPALTRFLPVNTSSSEDGLTVATPVTPNTSGDFAALSGTAGYVELRQEQNHFPAGTAVPLHLWDCP
jgi:molybdopterin molybdotransferase